MKREGESHIFFKKIENIKNISFIHKTSKNDKGVII
jgi:hypothetical protein